MLQPTNYNKSVLTRKLSQQIFTNSFIYYIVTYLLIFSFAVMEFTFFEEFYQLVLDINQLSIPNLGLDIEKLSNISELSCETFHVVMGLSLEALSYENSDRNLDYKKKISKLLKCVLRFMKHLLNIFESEIIIAVDIKITIISLFPLYLLKFIPFVNEDSRIKEELSDITYIYMCSPVCRMHNKDAFSYLNNELSENIMFNVFQRDEGIIYT